MISFSRCWRTLPALLALLDVPVNDAPWHTLGAFVLVALAQKTYDATLDVTRPEDPPDDSEADAIFREMKKREF